MAIVLYEISWSHFCEKARFCLDFKRLPYRLQARVAAGGHLVGGTLTLADIAAVSLLDPLEIVPEFVRDQAYGPLFSWKRGLARAHRRRQRTPWISGDPPPGYPLLDGARS